MCAAVLELTLCVMGRPPEPEPLIFQGFMCAARLAPIPSLLLRFIASFCMSFIFDGEVQEIQPWSIGFRGTMPIEQLESMVFGNHARRLEYTASSGLLCPRGNSTRKEIAPVIDTSAIPVENHIFTLLDTVSHHFYTQDALC